MSTSRNRWQYGQFSYMTNGLAARQVVGYRRAVPISPDSLASWLNAVDNLPLECDGMTRVISALLTREDIAHQVNVGRLEVSGQGVIPRHWWITLPEGWICDYRARMWLGTDSAVPHGVFLPAGDSRYQASDTCSPRSVSLPSDILFLMSGLDVATYPRLQLQV